MASQLTEGRTLPDEVLEQIVVKTDGVPLFVEELTKTVLASGLLRKEDERFVLDGALPPLAIPSTLQDSLVARLDKLAPVKEVAQLGAAIGREFSYDLLAPVSELPERMLNDALDQLTQSELVFARGVPPDANYTFKHALVQDAAYQSLLKSRRQQIHARITQVLEQQFPDRIEVEPELLAHHYSEARLTEQAVTYWHRAGERAVGRSAHLEAIGHLDKGLKMLEDLPAGPERNSHELNLQSTMGPPLIATKGYGSDEVGKAYSQARELWSKVGGDTVQLCPILYGLWANNTTRAQHETAWEISRELFETAQSLEDPAFILDAHLTIVCSSFLMGEFDLAREHGDGVIKLYDPQLHGQHALQNPGTSCGVISALALWMLGFPDQALARSKETVSIAREVAHPFSLAVGLTWQALLHHCRRDAAEARSVADEVVALCTEQGFPYWASVAAVVRGWALTEQGHGDEGMVQIREGAALVQATGARIWRPYRLSLLAEAHTKAGQVQGANDLLDEALTVAGKTKERYWQTELHRMKGELHLARAAGGAAKAETCFKQALKVARGQNAKSLELRAATCLARLWQGQGKRAKARDTLAPIYDWFTEGFDTADLQEANVLLEELDR
jgi:predicted ATPase